MYLKLTLEYFSNQIYNELPKKSGEDIYKYIELLNIFAKSIRYNSKTYDKFINFIITKSNSQFNNMISSFVKEIFNETLKITSDKKEICLKEFIIDFINKSVTALSNSEKLLNYIIDAKSRSSIRHKIIYDKLNEILSETKIKFQLGIQNDKTDEDYENQIIELKEIMQEMKHKIIDLNREIYIRDKRIEELITNKNNKGKEQNIVEWIESITPEKK